MKLIRLSLLLILTTTFIGLSLTHGERRTSEGIQFIKDDHPDYYDRDISSRVEELDLPAGSFKPLNESELMSDIKFHQRCVVIFHEDEKEKIPSFFSSIMKELRNVNNDLMFGEYSNYQESEILKNKGLSLKGTHLVLFFQEGNAEHFTGDINDKFQVFPWLRERIISYFSIIRTSFEFNEFLNDKDKIKILGFFHPQLIEEKEIFMRMITQNYFIEFSKIRLAITDNETLVTTPSGLISPQIIIYKHLEKETYSKNVEIYPGSFYDDIEIRVFCLIKSLPTVMNFTMENLPRLSEVETIVWLMLDNENEENNQKVIEDFTKVAEKYEQYRTYENIKNRHLFGRMQFVIIPNIAENSYVYRLYLGKFPKKYPTMLITFQRHSALNTLKFFYNEDQINADMIEDFLIKYEQGSLQSYFKSQEIPSDDNAWPVPIVGSSYSTHLIMSNRAWFILYCSPDDEYNCKIPLKILENLANRIPLDKRGRSISLGTFDSFHNEHPYLFDISFPDLKYYPANKPRDKPIKFNKDFTFENVYNFIQAHEPNYIHISEEDISQLNKLFKTLEKELKFPNIERIIEKDFIPKKHDSEPDHDHAHVHKEDEFDNIDVEEARAAYYRAKYEENKKDEL